jgi:hypothetical protein
MTTAAQGENHRQVLEACVHDCAAARAARADADHLLECENPDTHWVIQAWCIAAPPGEIRLTLAGTPCGRVPRDFQIKWMQALMDAA